MNILAVPRCRAAVALLAAALLAGCAKPKPPPPSPKPKPPALLSIRIAASALLNPDARARPSPVVLRLYELKSPAQFEAADFVSLFDKDQATLGADVVAREELVLRPTETKSITKPLDPDTRFVAVMAAFRELERARWRSWVPIVADRNNAVTIDLDAFSVRTVNAAP